MPGVKGKSGRKRNIRNIQKYFNQQFDLKSNELVEKLLEKAADGDRELLIYVFDRRIGKPKAQTDVNLSGMEELGAGAVAKLFMILAEKRRELEEAERPLLVEVESNPT